MSSPHTIEAYRRARKTKTVCYVLCLFLGLLGMHRFYLRRRGTAVIQLVTLGGFGLWWLIDLFLIPQIVHEENRRTAHAMGITADDLAEAGFLDKETPVFAIVSAVIVAMIAIGVIGAVVAD